MKKNLTLLLAVIAIFLVRPTLAQERYVSGNNKCLSGEADASITRTGVKGYIQIENTCDRDLYFGSTSATVQILKVTVTKSTGKETSSWVTQSLSWNAGLFLKAGSKARLSKSGNDNDALSTLLGAESYFTDVKRPALHLGEPMELNYDKPNDKCFKVNLSGVTPLFELNGMTYAFAVSRVDDGNMWHYSCALQVTNNNGDKVKFEDNIEYKSYFCGLFWNQSENFHKIKPGNTKTHEFSSARFNITPPSMYIEFTKLPALEDSGTGDQLAKIPIPQ